MKKNSILKAESYKARFLEAGVVKYDNEMVLIKPENLMNIAEKFKGCYVVIEHQDLTEEDKEEVVGYISKVWMGDDGWAWCDFIVYNEEAINLINNKNYSVSCAYYPKYTVGGTYHNIPYDREVVDGDAIHLAIVDNPRYEDALILKNSINKIMTIFKFKKEEKKENSIETKEISLENALFEIEEGNNIPVADMVEAYKNAKEEEERKKKEEDAKVNAEDEFEIDGKMVKVSELVSAYKSKMKKNEEEEEEIKKNEEEEEKKEAEKDEEEKKEAKKNSKDFEGLKNAKSEAIKNSSDKAIKRIDTPVAQIERGKNLYGSN